jgi:hypothetical protein
MPTPTPVPRDEIEVGKRYQYLSETGSHDSFHGEHGVIARILDVTVEFRGPTGERWYAWYGEVYAENTKVPFDVPATLTPKEQAILELINNCTARTPHGTYHFRIASVEQVDGKPVLVLEEIPK